MKKRLQHGFTLIEIMLVLVLLSLSAVAVIATLPNNSDDVAKSQAQRLYQRLRLLSEEAILSGQDFGIRIDEARNSYTLLHLKKEGWQPVELHKIKAKTTLDNSIQLTLKMGGDIWKNEERLFNSASLFDDDSSLFEPSSFDEKNQDSITKKTPQILLLSSGELTPMQLTFTSRDSSNSNQAHTVSSIDEQNSWRIIIKENGEIRLLAAGEDATEGGLNE